MTGHRSIKRCFGKIIDFIHRPVYSRDLLSVPFLCSTSGVGEMMTIAGKALGRRRPLFADYSIPLPPDLEGNEGTTLRNLISVVVRHEVAAFREGQSDRRLWRAMTQTEINTAAETGKVAPGPSDIPQQPVDEEEAVAVALQAFTDGLYLVAIDAEEQRELDQQIFLQPDCRITFIRLTLLAGG